jgi:hypothetical protein
MRKWVCLCEPAAYRSTFFSAYLLRVACVDCCLFLFLCYCWCCDTARCGLRCFALRSLTPGASTVLKPCGRAAFSSFFDFDALRCVSYVCSLLVSTCVCCLYI